MSSGATLTLASSPASGAVNLNLSGGSQTINALYFGTTQKAAGTWAASGATHNNPAFIGLGVLNVSTGPASTTGLSLTSGSNPSAYGSLLTFTATVTGNAPGGTVQFYVDGVAAGSPVTLSGGSAPFTTSTLTVSGSPHSITASYSGDDNNNPSSAASAVSVTVNQATPIITWVNPADITYGTALGGAQLNASASVPGAFAYNPTNGTVLNAGGNQALTASFTPTDANNYSNASATVYINVNQANAGGTFTAAPNPSLPGSDVTFTATITNMVVGGPIPDGTVLFKTNGVPLGDAVILDTNGVAAFITNSLPHGSNAVSAEYAGDGNFQGVTNSLVQVVNTPPTSSSISAGVTENQTLVLSVDKLLAVSSDPDGDELSVTSAGPASTNGAPVTLDGTNVIYAPLTNFVGMDLFSFVVTDPYGASATGTVLVTVSPGNVPPPNIVIPPAYDSGSGAFTVTFAGIPNLQYTIQTAPTPTGPWSFFTTATAGANGLFQVTDTELPPPPERYYRTVYP